MALSLQRLAKNLLQMRLIISLVFFKLRIFMHIIADKARQSLHTQKFVGFVQVEKHAIDALGFKKLPCLCKSL